MSIGWTPTQKQKLLELNADSSLLNNQYDCTNDRNQAFQEIERKLVTMNKENLIELKNSGFRPLVSELENKLINRLCKEGFVEVSTPIMLAKSMLEKMSITSDHPLNKQVFWIDNNKCLRPMLAPNLYYILKDLERTWKKPVRIFEVGPCFRKESQGSHHLNEFTMLNLVELGVTEGQQQDRLKELGKIVMNEVGIDYEFLLTESEVYGTTIDVVDGDFELGSGAYGPIEMDQKWGIFDPWVGIGFGLERLAMKLKGYSNIRRVGRSLSYLNGSRLNI